MCPPHIVILSVTKNLLKADQRQPALIVHCQRGDASPSLSMTAYSITPCVVILNTHSVILNGVKNLEVSETVDGSTNLEILRCTQDDIEPTIDHAHIAYSLRGDA